MRRLHALLAIFALTTTLVPRTALADGKTEAQELLTKGNELVGEGDYLAALDKFRAAYTAFPSPKILLNIGTTLRQLGRNVEAAQVYEQYLHDPGADPARVADVRRVLGELDSLVGRLRIESNVPDARVLLDGTPLAGFKSGIVVRVEPGPHTIVGERAGLAKSIENVTVKPKQDLLVKLELLPPEVKSRVVVREVTKVSRTQHDVGLVLGLSGAAAIGAGSVFGLLAKVNDNDAALHCVGTVCDKTGVGLGSDAQTDATVSTVAFIAGGVATAAGVVLLLTSPTRKAARAGALGPVEFDAGAGPGGGGVRLRGAF